MTLARHRIEIELRRSGDRLAKGRDEDELRAGRVRRGDPVQPVCARFALVERHDEADARALVHASLENLGEPFDGFGEPGGLKRGDLYGLAIPRLTGERHRSARRAGMRRKENSLGNESVKRDGRDRPRIARDAVLLHSRTSPNGMD